MARTNNRNEIITNSTTVEFWDNDSQSWMEKELPERANVIQEEIYQWKNPKSRIQQYLLNSDVEIGRKQFANAGKTAVYYLNSQEIFGQFGFEDMVDWDSAYLTEKGIAKPALNQIQVSARATFSAVPSIQDSLELALWRMWCRNGATVSMFNHRIPLEKTIKVDKGSNPLLAAVSQPLAQLPSGNNIQEALLTNALTSDNRKSTVKSLNNLRVLFDSYMVKSERGKDLPDMPNSIMANAFKPILNAPDWFRSELSEQISFMLESDSWGNRGVTELDVSNAITNVINHGGKDNKRESRAYLDNQVPAMTKALSTFIAFQN